MFFYLGEQLILQLSVTQSNNPSPLLSVASALGAAARAAGDNLFGSIRGATPLVEGAHRLMKKTGHPMHIRQDQGGALYLVAVSWSHMLRLAADGFDLPSQNEYFVQSSTRYKSRKLQAKKSWDRVGLHNAPKQKTADGNNRGKLTSSLPCAARSKSWMKRLLSRLVSRALCNPEKPRLKSRRGSIRISNARP